MIETLAGQGAGPKKLCRMLGVAPSGFYYWRSKPPSIRELRHEQSSGLIIDIHRTSMGTYGSRRVTAELRLGYEIIANRKAVAALMRSLGLQGLPKRKAQRRGPASDGSAASELVLRRFSSDAPNRLWLTDITEHPTREGKLYCCQFTSWAFSERLKNADLALSMGRVGDAFDNAMMEAFWARLQTELLNRQRWRTRLELANAIFEYLEVFHNRRRRPSSSECLHQLNMTASMLTASPPELSRAQSITKGPDQSDRI